MYTQYTTALTGNVSVNNQFCYKKKKRQNEIFEFYFHNHFKVEVLGMRKPNPKSEGTWKNLST